MSPTPTGLADKQLRENTRLAAEAAQRATVGGTALISPEQAKYMVDGTVSGNDIDIGQRALKKAQRMNDAAAIATAQDLLIAILQEGLDQSDDATRNELMVDTVREDGVDLNRDPELKAYLETWTATRDAAVASGE